MRGSPSRLTPESSTGAGDVGSKEEVAFFLLGAYAERDGADSIRGSPEPQA